MKIENQKIVSYKNISVFQGLNALRFIAALLVVLHHSETIKRKNGMQNFEWLGLFRNGSNAVTFFFVLSGFLITYLLLKERDKTNTIKVKTFYLKRILRIWPLYFLLVIIGTIGLPVVFKILNVNYEMPYNLYQTWIYFLFFLPGLVTFFFGHHFLEPLWSIGVEEVFYLIWAPLFKLNKSKILFLLISILVIKLLLHLMGILFIKNELFIFILSTFKFESMAIGGLGAYYLYTNTKLLSQLFIFKIQIQIFLFLTAIIYLTFHTNITNSLWNAVFKTPILSSILIECLFLYIIICISSVETSTVKLRNKTLSFLGEISYGIYMYHMLVIFGVTLFFKKFLIQISSPLNHIIFYSIVFVTTIAISILSKRFFENYFLKLKTRLE